MEELVTEHALSAVERQRAFARAVFGRNHRHVVEEASIVFDDGAIYRAQSLGVLREGVDGGPNWAWAWAVPDNFQAESGRGALVIRVLGQMQGIEELAVPRLRATHAQAWTLSLVGMELVHADGCFMVDSDGEKLFLLLRQVAGDATSATVQGGSDWGDGLGKGVDALLSELARYHRVDEQRAVAAYLRQRGLSVHQGDRFLRAEWDEGPVLVAVSDAAGRIRSLEDAGGTLITCKR